MSDSVRSVVTVSNSDCSCMHTNVQSGAKTGGDNSVGALAANVRHRQGSNMEVIARLMRDAHHSRQTHAHA